MRNKGPLILITGAAGLLVAAYAVQRLLQDPEVRRKVGDFRDRIQASIADATDDLRVDRASEESFPASDAPSHTP